MYRGIQGLPNNRPSGEKFHKLLANAASNLFPSDVFSQDKFSIELIYRSSIPDNITNWRVFEDDEQIINFLHSEDTFKGSVIDDEQHEALLQASASEEKP
jgi:hypothetical protein